jgi:CxxC motif-containing protein
MSEVSSARKIKRLKMAMAKPIRKKQTITEDTAIANVELKMPVGRTGGVVVNRITSGAIAHVSFEANRNFLPIVHKWCGKL